MRVVIAGAGSVGRSIARELTGKGHEVLLLDRDETAIKPHRVPGARWLLADCCELERLAEADPADCDVLVAATGDDKANLVVSLLAKTEFGVPRTVARVNNPKNEWMFDGNWGVDVAVSTPRLMTALVEEAVEVGDLVRLFSFTSSRAELVEFTLPLDSPLVGTVLREITWPPDTVLTCILRDRIPLAPTPDDTLEGGDELLFVTVADSEAELERFLAAPRPDPVGSRTAP
jgi:trk system potassium uptake protein TrkA